MFCSHCGKEMAVNGSYCSYCGKLTNNTTQVQPKSYSQPQGYQRNIQRQCEIAEVEKMINYFYQKSSQYNEYDWVNERLYKLSRCSSAHLIVWGCILLTLGMYGIICLIAMLATWEAKSIDVFSYSYEDIIPGVVFSATIIPGIILVLSYVKRFKSHNKEMAYCLKRFDELSNELYIHYISYKNCPIGPEYTNPSNLQVIYQTIVSGRADTTKEALNVLVEDAHRKKMEDLAETTARYAQAAAQASASAASSARTASFFAAANFFLN